MKHRIGVFGGAFDPPHIGHVNLAVNAAKKLGLDKVVVIPTGVSPHKAASATPYADRFEMARLAFGQYESFEVSDVENKPGKSYTVDTLRLLKERCPESDFYLIIGGDMLVGFDKWRGFAEISELCEVVAAAREDNYGELREYADEFGVTLLKIPVFRVSSSLIREKFGNRAELLPEKVYNYVKERGLYH